MGNMMQDMDFESKIKSLNDRELAEESFRQVYQIRKECPPCQKMVAKHETMLTRISGAIAVLGILFVAAVSWLFTRIK